ncbi:MAG: glutamate racemase [Helicobacteraceae bacterium]|jgi:glutamate racemase|nr:glutamate racemase [Helicobacteraceae bacterium]
MRAAVFDSGVGGLSVVKSLLAHRFFDEIVYYGDTARTPYGAKDQNTITRYSLEALEFLSGFEPNALIVACNTASAYALEELRRKASFLVAGVIEPGVMALRNGGVKSRDRVLVIATRATINSGAYQKLLAAQGYENVTAIAAPLLVPLVEEGIFDGAIVDETFKRYFGDLGAFDAVIMGCTHYPLMQAALGAWFGGAKLVHSGEAIAEYLTANGLASGGANETDLRFFASENVGRLKEVASKWLHLPSITKDRS